MSQLTEEMLAEQAEDAISGKVRVRGMLDHGYIRLLEAWGSDEAIVSAARMSTGKGFLGWGGVDPCPSCDAAALLSKRDGLYITFEAHEDGKKCGVCSGKGKKPGDEKLLRYLWENRHASPFEMAGFTIEVQAPIFVFREWHRHRTQSFNEMSARYAPLPDLNYIPSIDRLMLNATGNNKQAGTIAGAKPLLREEAEVFRRMLGRTYEETQHRYEQALAAGVPKELARVHLPVGRYSRMRASANLRNWLAFMTLRMDKAAQWEIRQYANVVGEFVGWNFPRVWGLFAEGLQRVARG